MSEVEFPTKAKPNRSSIPADLKGRALRHQDGGVIGDKYKALEAKRPDFNISILGRRAMGSRFATKGSLGGMSRPSTTETKSSAATSGNVWPGQRHAGANVRRVIQERIGMLASAGTTDIISLDRTHLADISAACAANKITHHTKYLKNDCGPGAPKDYMSILPDYCAPMPRQLIGFVTTVEKLLDQGKNILIHCTGGFGRTGTHLMAFVLKQIADGKVGTCPSSSIENDCLNAEALVQAYRCGKSGEFHHITHTGNPPGMLGRLWEYRKGLQGPFSHMYAVGGLATFTLECDGVKKTIAGVQNKATIELGANGKDYNNSWQLDGFPKYPSNGSKIDGTLQIDILSAAGGKYFPDNSQYFVA